MERTPLVSVIIPTYNRAALLLQAIASVLEQDYPRYELLVADDGSTDDTLQRVAVFGGRLRYLRLEHSGRPSVARNRALEAARGDLVAFLDDDDLWQPGKLTRAVDLLARDPAPGWVYGDFCLLQMDGILSSPLLEPHQKRSGAILTPLIGDCFVHTSTVLARRALLKAVGGFDESFATAEDYDLWLRLAQAAPAGFVPEPLVWVRRHAGEISHHRELQTYHNTIAALERLRARFPLTPRQRLRLRRALARFYTHVGLAHARRGEIADARRCFLRSLQLNPVQRRAWFALCAPRGRATR